MQVGGGVVEDVRHLAVDLRIGDPGVVVEDDQQFLFTFGNPVDQRRRQCQRSAPGACRHRHLGSGSLAEASVGDGLAQIEEKLQGAVVFGIDREPSDPGALRGNCPAPLASEGSLAASRRRDHQGQQPLRDPLAELYEPLPVQGVPVLGGNAGLGANQSGLALRNVRFLLTCRFQHYVRQGRMTDRTGVGAPRFDVYELHCRSPISVRSSGSSGGSSPSASRSAVTSGTPRERRTNRTASAPALRQVSWPSTTR
ncbi:hypothetical protein D3C78_902600 [compost metagenome]